MYLTIGTLVLALAAMVAHRLLGARSTKSLKATGVASNDRQPLAHDRAAAPKTTMRSAMMAVVTVLVLASGLYIILSKSYDDATQKWAFASIGAIVGFWLSRDRA
jgi:hypothetical protein